MGARTLDRLGGAGLKTDSEGRFAVEGLGPGRGSVALGSEETLLAGPGGFGAAYFEIEDGQSHRPR